MELFKKILITGGSGFISSHFHEVIEQDKIVNFDLRKPLSNLDSTYIKGDVRSYEDLDTTLMEHPCDIILALAAEHKDFGIAREEYFKTNEHGTQMICDAATKHGINKIVFYSSVAVYGDIKEPSSERSPENPNLPYGASKLAGEKVLHKWAKEDANRSVLIVRPTVVYGERNVANMFRLIHQIKKGRYFHIGKGDNIKSIAYVKNLVDATLYLMNKMSSGVQTFNYADEPQLTSRSIGACISTSLGRKDPITLPYWLVYSMGIPFDLLIKISGKDLPISTNRVAKFCTQTYHTATKVREAGFVPRFDNREGLKRMVDWQLKGYNKSLKYHNV